MKDTLSNDFRILFVDDEETFLQSTADLLRREGYSCDTALHVDEASRLLQSNSYSLLIADIKMPGNHNLEFVRQLSASSPGIAVILVTAHPSIASAVQSVELPVVAYLIKPFSLQDLLAKVQGVAKHALVARGLQTELKRVHGYQEGLALLETQMRTQPRATLGHSQQLLAGMTMQNLLASLSGIQELLGTGGEGPPVAGQMGQVVALPADLRDALRDAVATLERTKHAFKSKELGELRRRLERLL